MDKEFAARIKQSVDRQQLEHLLPRHLAALGPQMFPPKLIETQLAPQPAARPAVAKAPRRAHPQRTEPHLDHVFGLGRRLTVAISEKSPLQPRTIFLIDDLKRVLPARRLRRVQFAQMQHLALHHPTGMHAQALA